MEHGWGNKEETSDIQCPLTTRQDLVLHRKTTRKLSEVPRDSMIWACRNHTSPLLFSTSVFQRRKPVFSALSHQCVPKDLGRSYQPRNQKQEIWLCGSLAPSTGPSKSAPAQNHSKTPIKQPLCALALGPIRSEPAIPDLFCVFINSWETLQDPGQKWGTYPNICQPQYH